MLLLIWLAISLVAIVQTSRYKEDCLSTARFISYVSFALWMLVASIYAFLNGYYSSFLVLVDILCLAIVIQSRHPIKAGWQSIYPKLFRKKQK